MSSADEGGFQAVINVTAAAATRGLAAALPALSTSFPFDQSGFQGTADIKAAATAIRFAPGNLITATISLDGSTINVTHVDQSQLPPGVMQPTGEFAIVKLDGQVVLTDTIEASGLMVTTDLRPDANGYPLIDVQLNEDSLTSSPLIAAYLSWTLVSTNQNMNQYDQIKGQLITDVRNAVSDALEAQLATLVPIILASAPVLPGPCPPPFSQLAVATTDTVLRLMLTIGATPGNPAAITRDSLLLQPGTGVPLDAATIVLSNQALLRDLVRCSLIAVGGLPASGFLAAEPCFFVTPAVVTFPGFRPIRIKTLLAGIDDAGLLRVGLSFDFSDTFGTYTISGSASQSFALTGSPPTASPALTLAPSGPPIVSTQVQIASWVYALAVFDGGTALVATLMAVQALAAKLTNGALTSAIASALPTITLPLSLPGGAPTVAIRAVSSTQVDAPIHTVTVGGAAFPNPFRDHDVIINLI